MADLADLIQKLSFYKAGGKDPGTTNMDHFNQGFDMVNKIVGNVLAIKQAQLNAEKTKADTAKLGAETAKTANENTPYRDIVLPLTPQNATRPMAPKGTLAPDQFGPRTEEDSAYQKKIADQDALYAKREAMGNTTLDQAKTQAQIEALTAKANAPAKTKDELYINPTTREISMTPMPGFFKVSNNTAATIAAGPAKEESMANRQEASQMRQAEIKEQSENRAKNKADLQQISEIEGNLTNAKNILDKVPTGWKGAGQGLISKTGYGFPDAATYERTKPALSTSLYRAMTGDTRLSDTDAAARALPLLPSLNQSPEQRQQLWDFIDKAINNRKQKMQQGINEVPWNSVIAGRQSSASETPAPQIGQTRVKDGITYIKKEDGLWHPQNP